MRTLSGLSSARLLLRALGHNHSSTLSYDPAVILAQSRLFGRQLGLGFREHAYWARLPLSSGYFYILLLSEHTFIYE